MCEHCKSPANISSHSFVIEHIHPKSKGGTGDLSNLALAFQGCNSHKYAKTESLDPLTNILTPFFNPRIDVWKEHFSWSTDTLEVIGISPQGRTTIEALSMNKQELKNQRALLFLAALHPPKEN